MTSGISMSQATHVKRILASGAPKTIFKTNQIEREINFIYKRKEKRIHTIQDEYESFLRVSVERVDK